jgi:hypothetical protein
MKGSKMLKSSAGPGVTRFTFGVAQNVGEDVVFTSQPIQTADPGLFDASQGRAEHYEVGTYDAGYHAQALWEP